MAVASSPVGQVECRRPAARTAKNPVMNTIWYMVSVSADSVVVMPRTAAVTLPYSTALPMREQRADAEAVGAGRGHQQHAEEADDQRAGAREADLFLEPERGEQRGEQRRGEIDGDGAGDRHQAEGDQDQALRHRLGRAAADVIAQPLRAEYVRPGAAGSAARRR